MELSTSRVGSGHHLLPRPLTLETRGPANGERDTGLPKTNRGFFSVTDFDEVLKSPY